MIRKAIPTDIPQAAAIYEAIFDREEETVSYTNWQRGAYPTEETARKALEAGTFYIGEDGGSIWGTTILNGVQLPEYADIPWSLEAGPEEVEIGRASCMERV